MKTVFIDLIMLSAGTLFCMCSLFFGGQGSPEASGKNPRFESIIIKPSDSHAPSGYIFERNMFRLVAMEKDESGRVRQIAPVIVQTDQSRVLYVFPKGKTSNIVVYLKDRVLPQELPLVPPGVLNAYHFVVYHSQKGQFKINLSESNQYVESVL